MKKKDKIFFPVIYKDILERENISFNNNLIDYDKETFLFLLQEIEKKDIVPREFISQELLKYFPKNVLNLEIPSNIETEMKTVFNKLYGNLEIEDEIEYKTLENLVFFLCDRLMKTFLQNYLSFNYKNSVILSDYESNREVMEFELFMNYNFFKEYLEFIFPLILTIIDMQKNIFINNIKANDELKNNFLEETRKFYNVLLQLVKNIKQNFQIHRNKLYFERHIIRKSEILRFNFYDELEELKNSMDNTIKKFEEFENELIEHKLFVVNKIKENKKEFKDEIVEYMGDISEIIGKFFGGILK